jgi:hypothetical protein
MRYRIVEVEAMIGRFRSIGLRFWRILRQVSQFCGLQPRIHTLHGGNLMEGTSVALALGLGAFHFGLRFVLSSAVKA